MKLVQFLKDAFIDGHLYKAGEQALVGDEHWGAHIAPVGGPQPEIVAVSEPMPEANTGD